MLASPLFIWLALSFAVIVSSRPGRYLVKTSHGRYKGHVTDGKNPFGHYYKRNHFGDYYDYAGKNPGVGKTVGKLLNDKAIKNMIKNVADKGELPSIGDATQAVLNSKAIRDLPAIKCLPAIKDLLGNVNGIDYMDYVKNALSGSGDYYDYAGKNPGVRNTVGKLLNDKAIKNMIKNVADKGELPSIGDATQAVLNSKAIRDLPAIKCLPAIKDLLGNVNGNDYMDSVKNALSGIGEKGKNALSVIGEKGKELLKDDGIKKVIRDIADKGELPSAGDVAQAVLNSKAIDYLLA